MRMKQQTSVSVAALLTGSIMVSAQPSADTFYQLNGKNITVVNSVGSTVVKDKPFSATEEQHFLQVLSDGTRIETRQTTRMYRDGGGRVRLEDVTGGTKTQPGFEFGPITIVDPVARTSTAINPQTQQKLTMPSGIFGEIGVLQRDGNATLRLSASGRTVTIVQPSGRGRGGATGDAQALPVENLGTKNVNGVMARGERTVSVIPAGEIGNNREIRIVNERWYSDDLQLLIKSTNTDPRFGDTTYELTGIVLGEPSASLFDVPDYPETRVGRGGIVGGAQPTGAGGRGRGKK